MKIDNFTNLYSMSKTLRFKLIPQGETEEHFILNHMLENDEKRMEYYSKVKKIIDRYHAYFINETLSNFKLSLLNEYEALYFKKNRTSEENEQLDAISKNMMNQISHCFIGNEAYKKIFGKELIRDILPAFCETEEEIEQINSFNTFTTYFKGFNENRENMYTGEGKSTEIAFRIVNQNLPKYLDNIKTWQKIEGTIDRENFSSIDQFLKMKYGIDFLSYFKGELFNDVLNQKGIDIYNLILGGTSLETGEKIQGVNEIINLFNQKNKCKLPQLKPLFKQILSDRESFSFIPEDFKTDIEVIDAIKSFHMDEKKEGGKNVSGLLNELYEVFSNFISNYDLSKIYIKNDASITKISKTACGDWNVVGLAIENEYDKSHKKGKDIEKYIEKRSKELKKIKSYSISKLDMYLGEGREAVSYKRIEDVISEDILALITRIDEEYEVFEDTFCNKEKETIKIGNRVSILKKYLDSMNELKKYLKILQGSGIEEDKDDLFYGTVTPIFEQLEEVTILYNRVRNYVTRKPYSKDKIKLNFDNAQLLSGWDKNKEREDLNIILRKNGKYYLGIMAKNENKSFVDSQEYSGIGYEKMVYKQIPNASKYLSSKQILPTNPPEKIKEILVKKKADPKSITREEKNYFISYLQNDFLKNYDMLFDENGECYFDFSFKKPDEYETINEFFLDVDRQGYSIKFVSVSEQYINNLVNKGALYLFEIYSKDFSEYSKGTPNLHTMYFNMLFNENNLEKGIYGLSGGAELFYRKASIKPEDEIIHPANNPIKNKNPLNDKKESVFDYDLIKDKRFTKYQFTLHFPIKINMNALGVEKINNEVRQAIKNCNKNYIIGIDRGERNLIYICVIDDSGHIVEQESLNEIINEFEGRKYVTDYHLLLDNREKENLKARQEWKTIEGIKDLKEGYISQVIHKICQLVETYDAVIAMEDLNGGFKNNRKKVEKEVYQKFEKMLIDKLNYYVNKRKGPDEIGGLLNGYQLTNKFESFSKMSIQNGFIFYIPAWNTSKIDPTTGFVNLISLKYQSIDQTRNLISSFDEIRYNQSSDYFEFHINYDNFERGSQDYTKRWVLCSYGKRIKTFRNPEKNSEWDNKEIDITEEFKNLFDRYNISYSSIALKEEILKNSSADFYKGLLGLMSLMVQMRNSISGTNVDYIISPVKNKQGKFYCSSEVSKEEGLPIDADANGAYNIARKALWAIDNIRNAEDVTKVRMSINKKEWLQYAQINC